MFGRKSTQSEIVVDTRKVVPTSDNTRCETARTDLGDAQSAWNSWGERNPLSVGSFGRW